ncbi:HAD-IA family hydrolase [Kineococcus sp. NPDC059986]|uniref:HAD-IA family hydrolase n=1 Tax=Kineococcus sp. NPDC059986 TaxID=3155538 RepID=UPI00344FDA6B
MVKLPQRGVLFDSDGVLVDSDASVHSAWSRWARAHDLDPEHVSAMVHGRRSADTVALLITPELQRDALAEIDRFEVEDARQVTAMPGSADLLATLPAGTWAVVTSAVSALATARLRAAGLPLPEVLVTADDVSAGKPSPEGYRAAAARLGVDPAECVVAEDSPAGVLAGLEAGATVVGVGDRALETDATVVVQDLRGLRWTGDGLVVVQEFLLRG